MVAEWSLFNLKNPEGICRIPGGTIMLAYRGSIAHNMYIPGTDPNSIDDVDLMGLVIGPESCYLGLTEWGSRGTKEYKEAQYDCVFYEIRKAVSLLLQGNPNILGMLWLRQQDYLYLSGAASELIANRHLFVGEHVYNAFAGYAHAQLEKMESRDPGELREYMAITAELKHRGAHPNHKGEVFPEPKRDTGEGRDVSNWDTEKLIARLRHYQKKGENIGYLGEKRKGLVLEHGYDSKNAAHLIRLLRMCKEFMETGELIVYRTTDAAELLDIKRGKWPLEDIKRYANELFVECREARDRSHLRSEPDRAQAERILVDILRQALLAPSTKRSLQEQGSGIPEPKQETGIAQKDFGGADKR